MAASHILEVRHLSKSLDKYVVLRDIGFTVDKSDITCVISASGPGKSTLLRCVSMLETLTTGEILFHENDITERKMNVPQYRFKMSMVFQSFNLFNNLTVLDNCIVGQTKVLKKNKDEAKRSALCYLEKVGMAPYTSAKPRQPPGGQRQHVAITHALVMEPEVLPFDEPTSALGPQMVGEVLAVMRTLAGKDLTMIIVTHEMAFARNMSNHMVFMADGMIEEEGTPAGIFGNPQKLKTKELLGRFMNG